MGKLTTDGWTRLDEMIATHGDDGTLALIATRMAEGESMKEIALSCGMTVTVIRRWLEDDEKRMEEVALARRCFAEELVYEGLREARDADIETVGLGKYRTDTFLKMAGKLDRGTWGEKAENGGGGGITVVVQRGGVVAIGENKSLGPTLQVMAQEIETIEGEVLDG